VLKQGNAINEINRKSEGKFRRTKCDKGSTARISFGSYAMCVLEYREGFSQKKIFVFSNMFSEKVVCVFWSRLMHHPALPTKSPA
jgi:hypothetical protein